MQLRPRWKEQGRLLALALAVVLPAAALIAFSIQHLKSLQREHAVQAAIHGYFEQALAISEKHLANRTYDMVETARLGFPRPDEPMAPKLDAVLAQNPWAAHAFVYDARNGLVSRSQPGRMHESDFHLESEKFAGMIASWFPLEGKEIAAKLWHMEKKEAQSHYAFDNRVPRGDRTAYQSVFLFPLHGVPENRVTIAGIAFDSEYLTDQFLPQILAEMVNLTCDADMNSQRRIAMMVHLRKDARPLAASSGWDGGPIEVERMITPETGFPDLMLAMKYQGTTVEALSQHFLRTSYMILGALSFLMACGIAFMYRNVKKEVALAKLKSDFVSNVSHELRTPLSLIRLYAETLEMGRLSQAEKYQEYYEIIRKESERLTALINNILDFSRIEAGRKEYDFRDTDVAELVCNTLEAYRYQIEQNGFSFQQNIQDGLPKLRLDREAIARSLVNLINNAVKYSADNKFISVNVYRCNGAVKLEVVDHGIGIPRHEQHKIFEKFYRASDPLVHNTKGSGLGLSLVRHIVQAHSGQVSVESAPGHGSKFTIVLPLDTDRKAAGAGTAA